MAKGCLVVETEYLDCIFPGQFVDLVRARDSTGFAEYPVRCTVHRAQFWVSLTPAFRPTTAPNTHLSLVRPVPPGLGEETRLPKPRAGCRKLTRTWARHSDPQTRSLRVSNAAHGFGNLSVLVVGDFLLRPQICP